MTGRGNVIGSAVSPCLKITGNADTYRHMKEDMDFDASPVLFGDCTLGKLAEGLAGLVLEIASGKKSRAECLGHAEYFIPYKYQEMRSDRMKLTDMQKLYSLEGLTAAVTGGATGLGLAITKCLAAAGARVAVISRDLSGNASEILAELDGKVSFYPFDITETQKSQEIADIIRADLGPCSILVNNAGNHCKKYIWDMSAEEYRKVLDIRDRSLRPDSVPPADEKNSFGRILFLASMTSYIGQPQVCGYTTAKQESWDSYMLGRETASFGVTVNYRARLDRYRVPPGYSQDPARLQNPGRIPAGQIGSPMDVGPAAFSAGRPVISAEPVSPWTAAL
ncbi:MAG: SDR family NAD(P)-dependent oxidoreductase [Eisenbergiella sp.]